MSTLRGFRNACPTQVPIDCTPGLINADDLHFTWRYATDYGIDAIGRSYHVGSPVLDMLDVLEVLESLLTSLRNVFAEVSVRDFLPSTSRLGDCQHIVRRLGSTCAPSVCSLMKLLCRVGTPVGHGELVGRGVF